MRWIWRNTNENVNWNSCEFCFWILYRAKFWIIRNVAWMVFLLGGGYLLIENWDSITVWMHSLNIVQGLDGYEDMSNSFIFICLVVSGFILILLSPIFIILIIVCFVLMNIVACTLVLLTSPSTYIKKKDKENEWE